MAQRQAAPMPKGKMSFPARLIFLLALLCFLPAAAAGAETHRLTVPLDSLTHEGSIDLRGESSAFLIKLPAPARWEVKKALLRFSYVNSSALDPGRSRLVIRLNGIPQGQVALHPRSPKGDVEVSLSPKAIRAGYNELTFDLAQHVIDEECSPPDAPELWTNLQLDAASIALEYDLRPVPQQLASIADFLFDPKILGGIRVNIIVEEMSETNLKAAALAAAGAAIRFRYRPVEFSVSEAIAPGMDNILIGGEAFVRGFLKEKTPLIDAALISLHHLPTPDRTEKAGAAAKPQTADDPLHALLVIAGATEAQVLRAAQCFSFLDYAASDRAVARIAAVRLPEIDPYSGVNMIETGRKYDFKDLGFDTHTFAGLTPGARTMAFHLPSDQLFKPNRYAVLSLHLAYGSGMLGNSTMNVLVNDHFVRAIPLDDRNGGLYQGYRIDLPSDILKAGRNVFTFVPVLTPLVSDPCQFMQKNNLRLTLFDDSSLEIAPLDNWIELPRLDVLFQDGFPFAKWPDFRETSVLLTDRSFKTAAAAVNLIAALCQKNGIPPFAVTFEAERPTNTGRNLVVIGPWDTLPREVVGACPLGTAAPVEPAVFELSPANRAQEKKEQPVGALKSQSAYGWITAAPDKDGPPLGPGQFLLSEFESPYAKNKTLLLVSAADPAALLDGAAALWDSGVQSRCTGDLVLIGLNGPQVTVRSQKAATPYYLGERRGISEINRYAYASPWAFLGLLLAGILILAWAVHFLLKRYKAGRMTNGA